MFKIHLKILLGRVIFLLRIHRILLRGRAVVVAFHSVNDQATASDINCTPDLFREYCKFFDRYFDVITLGELLQRQRDGRDIAGCLVITFDDGYKDNLDIAAPILSSMDLPATFFVTTGFIESDRVAPWDAELAIKSEWMNWDDVANLAQLGFDIGGHTVNHPSLADIDRDDAAHEILECKKEIESRLGQPIPHFAYPFGGRENFWDDGIELVQRAEFECCVSCHGGTVDITDNPFKLQRAPVTTRHRSPYDFGFDCATEAIR